MRTPIQALVWEQWRQVRWIAVLGVAVTWCVFKTLQMAFPDPDPKVWEDVSNPLVVMALILVMAGLLFTHSSVKEMRMSPPPRLLTLPVSGFKLALAQVGFRFAVLIGVGITLWLILTGVEPLVIGVAVLVFAYASAIGSTVGRRSSAAAFVITLFSLPLTAWAVIAANQLFPVAWEHYLLAPVFFGAACILISFLSVATVRRTYLPWRVTLLTARPAPRLSIVGLRLSPAMWMELRRSGLFFLGLPVGLYSFIYLFSGTELALFTATWQTALVGPCVVGFSMGLILRAREHRDYSTGLARHTWTRPQTIERLVLGRMAATSMCMLAVFATLGMLGLAGIAAHSSASYVVTKLAASYALLVALGIVLMWIPELPLLYFVYIALYSAIADNAGGVWSSEFAAVAFAAFLYVHSLLLLAWLAVNAYRRKLFSLRTIGCFILIPQAVLLPSGLMAPLFTNDVRFFVPVTLLLGLGLLPLVGLLWQGVFLDRLRHGSLFRSLPDRTT